MTTRVFPQTEIAVIWDFDKTLIPEYMQKPLFAHFDVDEGLFWQEVKALPAFQKAQGLSRVSPDTVYLNHILTYVREGPFAGLNNKLLRSFGAEIEFYPGLPGFFPRLKQLVADNPLFAKHGISVEHYIISTGLREIILGSAIAEHVDDVWACEFVEQVARPGFLTASEQQMLPEPELKDIGYVIDNTTKTRAVFEINKGANKHPDKIDVNARMAPEDRRIPFENMIYIADGPSDVPVFSVVTQYDGKTYAVFKPQSKDEFLQVRGLLEDGRVQAIGEADYREGTPTDLWITTSVEQIAGRIVREREEALGDRVGRAPGHILDEVKPEMRVVPPSEEPLKAASEEDGEAGPEPGEGELA
jgi:hypothetical protein